MLGISGSWLGPGLVTLFCLSQAFRDVYFGHVFQTVDFFAVILIAFLLSTVIFTLLPLLRSPRSFGQLRGHWRTVLTINLTTALAWSCYFGALSRVEPAIVNTLHSGMGPLTVVAAGAFGWRLAAKEPIGRCECFGYAGLALTLVGLGWVVLSGRSGMAAGGEHGALLGIALLIVSGCSITVSLLYCKRLQDAGVGADVVTAVRYILLIAVAAVMVLHRGADVGIGSARQAAVLAVLATALIVLPLYAFQVGTGLTAALTANVLRSLGPVFIFALQQADGRLHYSTPTLIGILAYSVAAILATAGHGLRHAGAASRKAKGVSSGRRPKPEPIPGLSG